MAELSFSKQVDLQPLHSLALPAKANVYCQAKSLSDIHQALRYVHLQRLPLFVLGGGSNCYFADDYFSGLVLHIASQGVECLRQDAHSVQLKVAAGMVWDDFLQYCLSQGYYGLENLAIIPGTVGAAPVQNIGAYGQEVASCISSVHVIEVASGQCLQLENKACQFGYRDSLFKRQPGRFIISHVEFTLAKTFSPNLSYQVLADALKDHSVTAKTLRQQVISIRQHKLPDPNTLPNCGSFFKNPEISQAALKTLLQQYPDVVHYPQPTGQVKIAAAWLIEQAGFKGQALGPVAMHDKQALVLVNHGLASFNDVSALALAVKDKVHQLFAIELEQEPIVVR